jgi:5-methylcytosine-specific restriction endonuclease McrA
LSDPSTIRIAITVAMERVSIYADFTAKQFNRELEWQLTEVCLSDRGLISWRKFKLGRQLTQCLAEAQNWRCCYCGIRTYTLEVGGNFQKSSTLEHVIPLTCGGDDHPDNLVIACKRCNTLRGAQELESFLRLMNYYRWRWRISHKYDDHPLPRITF